MRGGQEVILPKGRHTLDFVYSEMLYQICRDYPALPDPRTLTLSEIGFWYDGLRTELKKATKEG